MTDEKKADQQASRKNSRIHVTSGSAQRNCLLAYSHEAFIDTIIAGRERHIMMPAARMQELLDAGRPIDTQRIAPSDDQGYKHEGHSSALPEHRTGWCSGDGHMMLAQPFPTVARQYRPTYSSPAGANSPAGFGDPSNSRRKSADHPIAGVFSVPAMPCYGGCAWETERSAGFLLSRFANLRTAATLDRLATVRGSSNRTVGASSHETPARPQSVYTIPSQCPPRHGLGCPACRLQPPCSPDTTSTWPRSAPWKPSVWWKRTAPPPLWLCGR